MYYTGFDIKNYKGIKLLKLNLIKDPQSKIFTLVGLNESGKTTILEAISLLNIPDTPHNVHDYIPKSHRINFNETIDITARLSFDEKDIETITEKLKGLGFKNVKIDKDLMLFKIYQFKDSEHQKGSNKRLCLFNISLSKGKSKTIKKLSDFKEEDNMIESLILKELIPPILYYPNFLFDFPEKIFLEETVNESDEQPLYREVIGDILSSIDPNLTIEKHILSRLKANNSDAKRSLDSTLLKMSSKVTKIVFDAWEAIFDSKGKEIVISYSQDKMDGFYLEFNLKEHSNYYQIAERSLGFRWFFTFLLFTEFRKNRANNNGEILFMLDEPASNLHSTAQKKLLQTFEKILKNSKLIYTTHSHHLINPKWLSGAYIVRNKTVDIDDTIDYSPESTDIEAVLYKNFVAAHPNQRTYFQP
ncbi:AAA family ATPase, partial [Mucilaginibacter sp.]|uniref:AAA family ATPase n=1 Tax=Mucilaginibacter sp. TaxID=1882438 RepID=UPI002ED249F0